MAQYSSLLRGLTAGPTFLFLFAPTAFTVGQTVEAPSVDACVWILMDYVSGKVLVESNADEELDPVSLIKIVTSCVVGQAFKADKAEPTSIVVTGKDTWMMGNSTLRDSLVTFLKPGDQVPAVDSNRDVIIQPGNDACIALADYTAGSQESFIGLMNGYAKKLGLTNTTFQTVHGLDASGQFSTARDMASLGRALIHDAPEEYIIHKEKESTFNRTRQPNHNRLLWNSNLGVDDVKTGTTAGTGYNLIASAIQGDMRLISVMLGVETGRTHFNEPEKLLTWGFRFFETVTSTEPDATFVTQRAWFGDKSEVNLGAGEADPMTISREQLKNLKVSYTLMESQPTAPLKKGQAVGTIDFQLNDKSIEQRPLITMEGAEEGGFFGRIWDLVMMKFHQ